MIHSYIGFFFQSKRWLVVFYRERPGKPTFYLKIAASQIVIIVIVDYSVKILGRISYKSAECKVSVEIDSEKLH